MNYSCWLNVNTGRRVGALKLKRKNITTQSTWSMRISAKVAFFGPTNPKWAIYF